MKTSKKSLSHFEYRQRKCNKILAHQKKKNQIVRNIQKQKRIQNKGDNYDDGSNI